MAIVGVETNYGSKTTEFSVFNSLYTQAIKMPKRSSWATKEIAELLIFCSENNIDPFQLEGSYAGAFGYGQFIPSSFNKLSIDYDRDGKKDPFGWHDVVGSVAFYLVENGYPKNDFNFAAMIHGDDQYNPKYLLEMLRIIEKKNQFVFVVRK